MNPRQIGGARFARPTLQLCPASRTDWPWGPLTTCPAVFGCGLLYITKELSEKPKSVILSVAKDLRFAAINRQILRFAQNDILLMFAWIMNQPINLFGPFFGLPMVGLGSFAEQRSIGFGIGYKPKDREEIHKVKRPTGANRRQPSSSSHWLAALSPSYWLAALPPWFPNFRSFRPQFNPAPTR